MQQNETRLHCVSQALVNSGLLSIEQLQKKNILIKMSHFVARLYYKLHVYYFRFKKHIKVTRTVDLHFIESIYM